MKMFDDIKMYRRFALGLCHFLRHRISLEEAKKIVQKRMQEREDNFARLLERGIYGYPRSPYLRLLKLAQCELGDIQRMVQVKGLEDTLRALRDAGVYVSFEEFKGRKPLVRAGEVFNVKPSDFDNPYLGDSYRATTGGTTGAGTRVSIDLDHIAAQAPFTMLAYDAHGVLDVPTALWYGVLPDSTGMVALLYSARFGNVPRKWFSYVTRSQLKHSSKYHLATRGTVLAGRLCGAALPYPEPVNLDQAIVVARWAAEALQTHGACLIRAGVSMALRVALAAREQRLNLTGATIMGGNEPPTPAKVREITRSGARWVPSYFFTEAGRVGSGCVRPVAGDDLHFLKDAFALIQYPRKVPGSEINVPAFHFTTLLPTTPKLMLNVESDDYGIVENRSCGCPVEAYGFTEHLREIRSFSKLTGEGVTLVGTEMVRILEEVLPERFGGSPLDYQWHEEEDEQGFTRVTLLISPKIGFLDEKVVIEVILNALSRSSTSSDVAKAIWTQAGTLRVKRIEPISTSRGKLIPLHSTSIANH